MRNLCFVLLLLPMAAQARNVSMPAPGSGVTPSGKVAGGQLYAPAETTDTATTPLRIDGMDAPPDAAVNRGGGNLILTGGIGTHQVVVDNYALCAGDTVTVYIDGATNTLTEGVDWTAATDNATTATSLAAAVDALALLAASSVTDTVYLTPAVGMSHLELAEGDATCTTLVEGADGQVLFPGGGGEVNAGPLVAYVGDTDTGCGPYGPNAFVCRAGGTAVYYASTALQLGVHLNAAGKIILDTTDAVELATACTGGSTGDVCTGGNLWLDGDIVVPPRQIAAVPVEPVVCNAANEGASQYVDDTNDTAYGRECTCANLDGTGYDWRARDDIVGTACPFY